MNKRVRLSLCSLIAGLSIASICAFSNQRGNSYITSGSHTHEGYHYGAKMNTSEETGHNEFWTCCTCHEVFLTKPANGTFIDQDDDNMVGGLGETHPAYLPTRDIVRAHFDLDYIYIEEDNEYYFNVHIEEGIIGLNDLIGLYFGDEPYYIRVAGLSSFGEEILQADVETDELWIMAYDIDEELLEPYYTAYGIAGIVPELIESFDARYFVLGENEADSYASITSVNYLHNANNDFSVNEDAFFFDVEIEFDRETLGYGIGGYCTIYPMLNDERAKFPSFLIGNYLNYEDLINFYVTDDKTEFEYLPGWKDVKNNFSLKESAFEVFEGGSVAYYSNIEFSNELANKPTFDSTYSLYVGKNSGAYYKDVSTYTIYVSKYIIDINIYPELFNNIISTYVSLIDVNGNIVGKAYVVGYNLNGKDQLASLQLKQFENSEGQSVQYINEFVAAVKYYS